MATKKKTDELAPSVRAQVIQELKDLGWTVEDRPMAKDEFELARWVHMVTTTNDADIRARLHALRLVTDLPFFKTQANKEWVEYEAKHAKPE